MEELREKLNKIVENDDISLCEKEIVMLSQQLDKLIIEYYLKQQKNQESSIYTKIAV